jgi:hypothetical protein
MSTNFANVMTGTVHSGRVRKMRADFTASGFVEWATADCEKGAAYRNINRMQLVATDEAVTCGRCIARTTPKPVTGFNVTITVHGRWSETFKTERSAIIWLVDHIVMHELFDYSYDAVAVQTVRDAVELSDDELAKKVAAKAKRIERERA